jgi:4-carboxymuconolactone decarboxylase
MSESEMHKKGMATRRKTLGAAYVDKAQAAKSPLDADFQTLITEAAWGHVWSRGTISARERSMMTLALLAGLGNFEELALHTRATANTGATPDDIMEAMLHVAIYAGVPRANHAIKVIKQVLAEMDGSENDREKAR